MRKTMVCDIPKGKKFVYRGDVYKVINECDCDDPDSKVVAERVSLYCKGRISFFPEVLVLPCE